tara:strand:+ start:381 stop:620 length:240 start_codon:yes stop_codon:yes gene_type:complete
MDIQQEAKKLTVVQQSRLQLLSDLQEQVGSSIAGLQQTSEFLQYNFQLEIDQIMDQYGLTEDSQINIKTGLITMALEEA